MSQKQSWQTALANLITDPAELIDLVALDKKWLIPAKLAAQLFPLKATHSFVSRIKKGDPFDPLLQQILPLGKELNETIGYIKDPLQEAKHNPIPGLLHKYHGRVLITLTSACAIHCRYCFRRHFPYMDNNPGKKGWEKIFQYIQSDTSISEIILSGGDPLAVPDKTLQAFSEGIDQISHIKRLRIHTRLPIVLPERITKSLLEWLATISQSVVLVMHINHAQEISEEVKTAIQLLRQLPITLLNQSVLLNNVNNNKESLIALSDALFEIGILPYYLHVLDKVAGAAHFDMPREEAMKIWQSLSQFLPGYLVPKLVFEEPGALSKSLILNPV